MTRAERILLWTLFCLLLAYCILRAWFVAPMHDEVATFLHFVEPGKIWGEGVLMDANNHLLNSFLNKFIYRLFGENFFLFRLPNVIAFVFYFWGAWKLSKQVIPSLLSWFPFLALISIPYIFDYFSYTRGYGIAICFFIWILIYLVKFLSNHKITTFYILITLLLLCIFANLIYLVSVFLILGIAVISILVNHNKFSNNQLVAALLGMTLFVLGCIPFIKYSFQLKDHGALYYGSLDGFWPVTLKTLSKYVLFYDGEWLKWLYIGLALLVTLASVIILKKKTNRLTSPLFWVNYLIIGNVVAIFVLAKFLNVNYPEDRAAMYLIPLCILSISSLLIETKQGKWLLLGLAFFPISFLAKLNLSTSIFSPDDRMTNAFFASATKGLKKDETISVYPIQQLTYPIHTRKKGEIKHLANVQRYFEPFSDVILTKSTMLFPSDDRSDYKIIAEDKESTYIAFRRKNPFNKKEIGLITQPYQRSNEEFLSLYSDTIPENWRKKALQLDISGDLETSLNYDDLNLVVSTTNKNGESVRYDYVNLRWYYSAKDNKFSFYFPYAAEKFNSNEMILNVYIWNSQSIWVSLVNAKIKIIELK